MDENNIIFEEVDAKEVLLLEDDENSPSSRKISGIQCKGVTCGAFCKGTGCGIMC